MKNIKKLFRPMRICRLKDAPAFFGMAIHRFNAEIRPYLKEIRVGIQGVGFDLLEMDTIAEQYIQRNGRPAKIRRHLWDVQKHLGSKNVMESGILTKRSMEKEFARVLAQVSCKKLKAS